MRKVVPEKRQEHGTYGSGGERAERVTARLGCDAGRGSVRLKLEKWKLRSKTREGWIQ